MLPAFLQASTFPRGRQATGGPHAPPHTEGPQQISPHTNTTNTEAVQWEALPGVFSRKRTGLPGSKSAAALLQELQRKVIVNVDVDVSVGVDILYWPTIEVELQLEQIHTLNTGTFDLLHGASAA
eukprot:scaffold1194_cov20-Tisochrysis_lutea.AAC.2